MKMKNKKAEQAKKRKAIKEERRKQKKGAVFMREEEAENIEKPRILIVCEGKNTEPSYFNQFEVKSATVTAVGDGYNTTSLVVQASELAEKGKSAGHPYDQIWCVFDKDDFDDAQFNEAIRMAEDDYYFKVAYSNQAFEYWLFLHLNDHQAGKMHRDDCCTTFNKLLAAHGCNYDKKSKKIEKLLFDLLLANDPNDIKNRPRQELAIQRAKRNLKTHNEEGHSPAQAESSTTVFLLVEELNQYT